MRVCLRTKFHVSSILLTSFRRSGGQRGEVILHHLPLQYGPLQNPPRLELKTSNFRKQEFSAQKIKIFDTLLQPIIQLSIKILQEKLDACSSIQFFNSPHFPITVSEVSGVTYHLLCSTCVTYGTPCHSIGHQALPIQPWPKEAEDFPRGGKYFNHVSLLTQLIYFPPEGIIQQVLVMCQGLLRIIILTSRWF